MATDESPGREQVRLWLEEIIEVFGPEESRHILDNASARLADDNGGTAKDWYAALTAAVLERHPDMDETTLPN